MVNLVVEQGILCNDIVTRKLPSGKVVCNFVLRQEGKHNSAGEKELNYIDVEAWDGLAEFIQRDFRRGDGITIEGRLKTTRVEVEGGYKKLYKVIAKNAHYDGKPDRVAKEED